MTGSGSNNVIVHNASMGAHSSNIASAGVFGHKKTESVFVANTVRGGGSGGTSSSYVNLVERKTTNIQGGFVSTGVKSDIALDGSGMFCVFQPVGPGQASNGTDDKGTIVFTRGGSFRQSKFGYLETSSGHRLAGWQVDENGNLPSNNTLLSSLTQINLANVKGTPKATTSLSLSMNLNSEQSQLPGAGAEWTMKRGGRNSLTGKSNPKDIIIPEKLSGSGLTIGDTFELKSTSGTSTKKFEYGGIAIAKAASVAAPIFGAIDHTRSFATGAIPADSGLSIKVGTQTINFIALDKAANTSNREFNSIQTLADAINKTSLLTARIDTQGHLYIAATDPKKSVDFADINGATFVAALGLQNIPEAPDDLPRFNSLQTLQDLINTDKREYQLKATVANGAIKITSSKTTDELTIKGESLGQRPITQAAILNTSVKTQATVEITAPNHGLRVGEFVNLAGMGYGQLPDGIYYVSGVSDNGFKVNLLSQNAANAAAPANGLANGFAAVGANPTAVPLTANASWSKAAGRSNFPTAGLVGGPDLPGAVAQQAGALMNITLGANHGIAADDIVYISGAGGVYYDGAQAINLPDGYYKVTALNGANGIRVNAAAVAPNGAPADNNLTVRKIGNVGAGGFAANGATTFNTQAFETFAAPNNNFVRLYLPKNNYLRDDSIVFKDLPAPYAIAGLNIENNKSYKVVNSTADYVDFQITDAAGAILLAGVAAVGNYVTVAAAAATDVTNAFKVNHFSRSLEYFGLDQEKMLFNTDAARNKYEAAYDPSNPDKSLPLLEKDKNTRSSITNQSVQVYDSLGDKYTLNIYFAKIDDNEWAVQVSALRQKDGIFEVTNIRQQDGLVNGASGIIKFNPDGSLASVDGIEAISIERGNGSAPSTINLDWFNRNGSVNTGSITQFARGTNLEFIQQDGQAAGTLIDAEFSNGEVTGVFDTGEIKLLYILAIATCSNMNGLADESGGTYSATRESGEILLKRPGSAGTARVISENLELSNADTTENLIQLREKVNQLNAVSRATGIDFRNQETILENIR